MATPEPGQLSFVITADTSGLKKSVQEAAAVIEQLAGNADDAGQRIDKSLGDAQQAISLDAADAEESIKKEAAALAELQRKAEAAAAIRAENARAVAAERKAEEALKGEVKAIDSLAARLREMQAVSASNPMADADTRAAYIKKEIAGVMAEFEGARPDVLVQQFRDLAEAAFGQYDQAVAAAREESAQVDILTRILNDLAAAREAAIEGGDVDEIAMANRRVELCEAEIGIRQELKEQYQASAEAADELARAYDKQDAKLSNKNSMRTQLRQMTEDLAAMEAAGERGSEAYQKLQKEAGALSDKFADARKQVSIMAHDNAGLQGVITGISGITGAFTAAQGAAGLFGAQSEELQKIMLKVQSVTAISTGMQQALNAINKDSAFRIVTLGKAKTLYAAVVGRVSKALQRFGVEQEKVGKSAGRLTKIFGGLAGAALAFLATQAGKAVGKLTEAREEAEKFNTSVAEKAVEAVAEVKRLGIEWESLGNDLKAKEKFINDNAEAFSNLGVSIKSVADAESLLIKNQGAFVAAEVAKAQAAVLREQAAEKIKEYTLAEAEYNRLGGDTAYQTAVATGAASPKPQPQGQPEKPGVLQRAWDWAKGGAQSVANTATDLWNGDTAATDAARVVELKEFLEGDPLGAGAEMFRQAFEKMQEAERIMAPFGGSTKEALSQYAAELQKTAEAFEHYAQLTNSTNADVVAQGEAAYGQLVAQHESYKAYLESELAKHAGAGGDPEKALLVASELAKITQAEADQAEALLARFADTYDQKLEMQKQYNADVATLNEALRKAEEAGDAAAAERAKEALKNRKLQYLDDNGEAARLAQLAADFATYEQRRTQIADQASKDRETLANVADEKERARLNEQIDLREKAQLGELANSELGKSIDKALEGIEENAQKAIAEAQKILDDKELIAKLKLSDEELLVWQEKLNKLREDFAKEGKDGKKSTIGAAFDKINAGGVDNVVGGLGDIAGVAGELGSMLGELGEAAGSESLQAVAHWGQVAADTVGDVAKGFEAGGIAGAAVAGVISIGTTVFNELARKANEAADKRIAESQKNLAALEETYADLETAISNAYGDEKYDLQKKQIAAMQEQQKELKAMADAEKERKDASGDANADLEKLKEYEKERKRIAQEELEARRALQEEILTTDAATAARNLGDAFIDAFAAGENAAQAWGKTVDSIIQNMTRKMITEKFLVGPIQDVIDKFTKGADGEILSTDQILANAGAMAQEMGAVGATWAELIERMPAELRKQLGLDGGEFDGTLKGAIKGVSEETAGVLAGQMNAIRITQAEGVEMLRQQLGYLSAIAQNTGYNRYLLDIKNDIRALRRGGGIGGGTGGRANGDPAGTSTFNTL